MIPVTLVKIDGYNGFLGTFDNENWWKSSPLPGGIDIVTDNVWIYGQYHVCSATMSDGTYSIYQSSDNGYSWKEVLNIAERINGIFKPTYGVALAATSSGWYRSVDSGSTWTKVTTTAPDCFCCKALTPNILIALSKNDIWRSANCGLSWTSTKTSTESIIYPAVAGTQYDCLVGIGKAMWYSDDGGLTWLDITATMSAQIPGYVNPNPWPSTSTYVAITDIELTSIRTGGYYYYNQDGSRTWYDNQPAFIIQILLPNGYLYHYYSERTPPWFYMFRHFGKFYAKSSINNSLITSEVLQAGSTDLDQVTIFVGTSKYDLPMIKISRDAGVTWTEIDTSNAVIYTGPDMSQISAGPNLFTNDIYFSARWGHVSICHNGFTTYDTYYERNISLDVDFLTVLSIPSYVTYQTDLYSKLAEKSEYDIDILNQTQHDINAIFDMINKGYITKELIVSEMLQKAITIPEYAYVALAGRNTIGYTFDITPSKSFVHEYYPRCYLLDNEPKNYSMEFKLIDNHTDEIMNSIERYTPQAPDIRYPSIPYNVWDSRKEGVTL